VTSLVALVANTGAVPPRRETPALLSRRQLTTKSAASVRRARSALLTFGFSGASSALPTDTPLLVLVRGESCQEPHGTPAFVGQRELWVCR